MVSCTCYRCGGTGREQVFQLEKRPEYSREFEQVTWSMQEILKVCSICRGTGITDGYGNSRPW